MKKINNKTLKEILDERDNSDEIKNSNSLVDYDDSELTDEEFKRMTAALIKMYDVNEGIPETHNGNERPFKY